MLDHNVAGTPTTLLSGLVVGSRIDFVDLLGRPAMNVFVSTSDPADVVEFRLNSLTRAERFVEDGPNQVVQIWSVGSNYPVMSATGKDFVIGQGLAVGSIEITSLTLASGTTIEMAVY